VTLTISGFIFLTVCLDGSFGAPAFLMNWSNSAFLVVWVYIRVEVFLLFLLEFLGSPLLLKLAWVCDDCCEDSIMVSGFLCIKSNLDTSDYGGRELDTFRYVSGPALLFFLPLGLPPLVAFSLFFSPKTDKLISALRHFWPELVDPPSDESIWLHSTPQNDRDLPHNDLASRKVVLTNLRQENLISWNLVFFEMWFLGNGCVTAPMKILTTS